MLAASDVSSSDAWEAVTADPDASSSLSREPEADPSDSGKGGGARVMGFAGAMGRGGRKERLALENSRGDSGLVIGEATGLGNSMGRGETISESEADDEMNKENGASEDRRGGEGGGCESEDVGFRGVEGFLSEALKGIGGDMALASASEAG